MTYPGVNPWPGLWAENENLLREARRMQYLVTVAASGEISCKACGRYLPYEDPEKHFAQHQAELDRYLLSKQVAKREVQAEGYYPNPCESCGNPIPKSGKPGRPPSECDACKYPFALHEGSSDEEILAEFGL